MITREEIRHIPELHKSIQRDREQVIYLRAKATSVPSGITDRERVQTSPDNSAGKYIDEAADLCREIEIRQAELLELQNKAKEFIYTVEDPLARRILRLRYLKCYNWDEVADLTGYDTRWIRKIEFREIEKL